VAFLFDTDALSEVLKKRPAPAYLRWLRIVPREEQFTSAVVIAELFKGAYRSERAAFHVANIERRVLPAVTVLPFDVAVAGVYGRIEATLRKGGTPLAEADLQIAATAIFHGLDLVTGNIRHFSRIPGLTLRHEFAEARG
jgi:predicted nucleic acid-binding protein